MGSGVLGCIGHDNGLCALTYPKTCFFGRVPIKSMLGFTLQPESTQSKLWYVQIGSTQQAAWLTGLLESFRKHV